MTAEAIETKKHQIVVQIVELYAGQNLRLQRDALVSIERHVRNFIDTLDRELSEKAD